MTVMFIILDYYYELRVVVHITVSMMWVFIMGRWYCTLGHVWVRGCRADCRSRRRNGIGRL